MKNKYDLIKSRRAKTIGQPLNITQHINQLKEKGESRIIPSIRCKLGIHSFTPFSSRKIDGIWVHSVKQVCRRCFKERRGEE
ncbi:MAG: hypothetical protein ACYTFW_16905 [Planctomycetota bacterium]|jgi:hypothetical protein